MAALGAVARRVADPAPAQRTLIGLLVAIAVAGWISTDDRMSGMDAGPGGDLGSLGFFVGAWVVMMAAMMAPSVAPMAGAFRLRAAPLGRTGARTTVFLGGYVLAWTLFGLGAYGLFELAGAVAGDALAWDRGGQGLAAGVLAAGALYQVTPLKDACLHRCRTPFSLLFGGVGRGWRDHLVLGARHGAWCVACCWGLMAALFALGVMSIAWMAFVAGVIAAEKLLPWPRLAMRAGAVLLAALALGVAVAPEDVPGLTVPGDAHGMDMETMPMQMHR